MAAAGAGEVKTDSSDSEEQTQETGDDDAGGNRRTFTPMRWRMCGRLSRSPPRPVTYPTLDNLTLARKEGWAAFVNAAPRDGQNR